jgi:beta-1,4-mannosyl-glycoprotein beta-1,4-N-acetylglucosaminyltransferase
MAIYDCFQFFNEEHILDLRLNILNEFVDFFVFVESTTDHQGKQKKLNFDSKKFKKFNDKIIYIVVDDTAEVIKKPHFGGESLVEQHQRNSIMRGLKNCADNDLIILSDVDEIPDPNKIKLFNKKNKYAVFSQKMFNYKINLLNETENNWHGSKICLKKDLKSPQWFRNLKFKKYPFWRIDKQRNLQIIENGGWHFAYLQSPENISKKIKSFAHGEFNKPNFVNLENIKEKINTGKDIFDRGISYRKVPIDSSFPQYIANNKDKFKDWIIE